MESQLRSHFQYRSVLRGGVILTKIKTNYFEGVSFEGGNDGTCPIEKIDSIPKVYFKNCKFSINENRPDITMVSEDEHQAMIKRLDKNK